MTKDKASMATPVELAILALRKPDLRVLQDGALNAEAAAHLLDDAVTPPGRFFVRNNGFLPALGTIDPEAWIFSVEGCVDKAQSWSLKDLKAQFESVSLSAVLECAGNGRAGFMPPTEGLQWTTGAVACGRWTGVRLRDVLAFCGILQDAVYTGHHSRDLMTDGSGRPALSRGLPIAKAIAPDTLLAFALNDEPLSLLHGGPLRVVAPGYPGSAWQKWLDRIEVRDKVHDGEKMNGTNYRLPRHPVSAQFHGDSADYAIIEEMPVKAMLTHPQEGFVAMDDRLAVRGFAWGGSAPVTLVEVSLDGGQTWTPSALEPATERYAWQRFTQDLTGLKPGALEIMARATDAAGRSQPTDIPNWNPRGYCNNAAHRLTGHIARVSD
jgi:sulfite oxidase